MSVHRRALFGALALFLGAPPLAAQVSEPDGLAVPQPVGSYELGMVTGRKKDMTTFFQASDVTLAGLFAARGEKLDPTNDAKTAPATFSPQCGFTGTLVMRGGACRVDFGWYNVNASAQIPTDAEIYTLIPKEDDSVFTCTVKESQYVTRTYQDFCPLAYNNLPAVQAQTPLKSFGADKIRSDPRYKGGQIGFALRGSGSPCSQTKFSEARLNTVCTSCKPNKPWITSLIYASNATPDGYYIAFEDLPVTPTDFKANSNDGDFNDFVYFVSGLTCSGAGQPCDTGLQGACAVGRTDCSEDGAPSACRPAIEPGAERCDNVDNDCNGQVDDGDGDGLCQAGQVCVHGACVEACGTGEFRCSPGFQCKSGFCIEDICANVNCKPGEICTEGACVNACDGVVCPVNQQCQLGRCVDHCVGVTCPAGKVCEQGLCLADCSCRSCGDGKTCGHDGRCVDTGCETLTCPDGQICQAGSCVDACTSAHCPGGGACQHGQCGEPGATGSVGGSDVGGGISLGTAGDIAIHFGGTGGQASSPGATGAGGARVIADPACACRLNHRNEGSGGLLILSALSLELARRRTRRLTRRSNRGENDDIGSRVEPSL